MKTKKLRKEVNNSSDTPQTTELNAYEKRKARIAYVVAIVVLILSLFSFLLFSPFKVPIFSQLGEKILGIQEVSEQDEIEETSEKEEEEEELEEIPKEEEEVVSTSTPTPAPETSPKPTSTSASTPTPAPTLAPTPTPTPAPTPAPTPEPPKCTGEQETDYEYKYCYNMYYRGYYVFSAEYYYSLMEDCPNEIYTDYSTCVSYYQSESTRTENLSKTYYANAMNYRALLVGCEYSEAYLDESFWACHYEGYEDAIASFGLPAPE